jgi:hypothetical protein
MVAKWFVDNVPPVIVVVVVGNTEKTKGIKMKRILIVTAWWPTRTNCFKEYSEGINDLLSSKKVETEFFITTNFHESKFGSIFHSMKQAEQWTIEHGFDYLLNIDSDIVLKLEDFEKMVELEKDVLLTGRGHGNGLSVLNIQNPVNGQIGWGCCLVKKEILELVPFVFSGDMLPPDRMWFKKLSLTGIDIWCNFDIIPKCLEESDIQPRRAFKPRS